MGVVFRIVHPLMCKAGTNESAEHFFHLQGLEPENDSIKRHCLESLRYYSISLIFKGENRKNKRLN
jgi:hypothetical protein